MGWALPFDFLALICGRPLSFVSGVGGAFNKRPALARVGLALDIAAGWDPDSRAGLEAGEWCPGSRCLCGPGRCPSGPAAITRGPGGVVRGRGWWQVIREQL